MSKTGAWASIGLGAIMILGGGTLALGSLMSDNVDESSKSSGRGGRRDRAGRWRDERIERLSERLIICG